MDTISVSQFLVPAPYVIATLLLMVSTFLLIGREPGSPLLVSGACLLFLMGIAQPLFYAVAVPRMLEDMGPFSRPAAWLYSPTV